MSPVHVGVGHQPRELFAPDPGDHIAGAGLRGELVGDLGEDAVARLVTVGVVDPLEVVDVDHGQRERMP